MRVLQPEAGEMHHRVAVRDVVAVFVRIKKQVRRIEHPHTAAPVRERSDDVESIDKRLVPIQNPVAIGVFVDGDLVAPADVVGRRGRHLVVNGAPIIIAAGHLQPGRVRVLLILHHPHPAALVEVHKQRLLHQRLRQQLINHQAVEHRELLERLSGRNWPRLRLAKRNRTGQTNGLQKKRFHCKKLTALPAISLG